MVFALEVDVYGDEFLTMTEAAVVAHVSPRDVNRVIDEQILPSQFIGRDTPRAMRVAGCPLVAFYVETAGRLTAEERRRTIRLAGPGVMARFCEGAERGPVVLQEDYLTIDLTPFLARAEERLDLLASARAAVSTRPDVLGGVPVFAGTRVPVHDVAASLAHGHGVEAILEAYPTLTRERILLAPTYADAYPLRGRPRVPHRADETPAERRVPRRPHR